MQCCIFVYIQSLLLKFGTFGSELMRIKHKRLIGFLGGRINRSHLGDLYYITWLSSARYFYEHNWF